MRECVLLPSPAPGTPPRLGRPCGLRSELSSEHLTVDPPTLHDYGRGVTAAASEM